MIGVILLWRARRGSGESWPWSLLFGSILMGFGAFNLVEGTLNHLILKLHHVNELVPVHQWVYWDIGFWYAALSCLSRALLFVSVSTRHFYGDLI
jgi:uncharacterized membrane protein